MPPARQRASRGVVVALEGPSGIGKSDLAAHLQREFGWIWLREAYDRLSPRPSLGFSNASELLALERRLLREDARRFREARTAARRGARVLADTDFLGPLAYTHGLMAEGVETGSTLSVLRAFARRGAQEGTWGLADLYVYLEAPEPTVARRTARAGPSHPAPWRERHRRVSRRERALWLSRLPKLLPGRVVPLDARGPPAKVAARFRRSVAARLGTLGSIPSSTTRRVLALFDPLKAGPEQRNR